MNLSTALSVSPLTVISGSMYDLPGAGWNRTSVFVMLIVSPKLEVSDGCEVTFPDGFEATWLE